MINTVNYSLEDAENGIIVNFPVPSNLIKQDQYILYFDAPVSLPNNAGNTVVFEPSDGSYAVFGSNTFTPVTFVKIKSSRKTQTKTLIRLTIKDTNNTILYTDYLLVVCYPESTVSINGKLLSYNASNLGPNGGSLIQITGNNESTSSVSVGSTVSGPGLDQSSNRVSKKVLEATSSTNIKLNDIADLFVGMLAYKQDGTSLGSISSINSETSVIVLSKTVTLNANTNIVFVINGSNDSGIITVKSIVSPTVFELNQQIGNGIEYSGTYVITTFFGCFTQTDTTTVQSPLYTVLDKNNNWTYKIKNQIIAQFIPDQENIIFSNLVLFLPLKNTTLLAKDSQPAPIPEISIIKLGGRAFNDSICVSNI